MVHRAERRNEPGLGGRIAISLFALVFLAASVGIGAVAWREGSLWLALFLVLFGGFSLLLAVVAVHAWMPHRPGDPRPAPDRPLVRFAGGRTRSPSTDRPAPDPPPASCSDLAAYVRQASRHDPAARAEGKRRAEALLTDVRVRRRFKFGLGLAGSAFLTWFCWLWFGGLLEGGINAVSAVFLLFSIPLAVATVGVYAKTAGFYLDFRLPVPTVTIPDGGASLGEGLRFHWRLDGSSRGIRRIEAILEGAEIDSDGDDSHTEVFANLPVTERSVAEGSYPEGSEIIEVPTATMHSLDGGRHAVRWRLHFDMVTRSRRRVRESFEVRVRPMREPAGDGARAGERREGPGSREARSAAGTPDDGGPLWVRLASACAPGPGGEVRGDLKWDRLDPATRRIDLRLVWYTTGSGNPEVSVVQETRLEGPGSTGERPFRFDLPGEPYSYRGTRTALTWAVEAVTDRGKAHRADFVMAPGGREILLHAGE